MAGFFFILISSAVLAYVFYALSKRRRNLNLPPGPIPLPFIGNLLQIKFWDVAGTYREFAEKYGSIVTFTLARQRVIILSDLAIIKEVFSREELTPRPRPYAIQQRTLVNNGSTGVVFTDGDHWKEHRRFILSYFKDFGVGKTKVEQKIIDEARYLKEVLADYNGAPVDTRIPVSTAAANVIANILTGNRYEAGDPKFAHFLELNKKNFSYNWERAFLAFLPWTKHVIPRVRAKYYDVLAMYNGLRSFFESTIGNHLSQHVPEDDFIGAYDSAIKSGEYRTFSVGEIPLLLEDLFEAGYDTTTTTLRWAFLLVALHENVQRKVHEELDWKLEDAALRPGEKLELPYTTATLMEVQRFVTIAPQGIPHIAACDTKIGSYDIPKGSWITANLRFVHHDPAHWNHPEKFDPLRFLDESGNVKPSDHLIPFSVGKRRCLGETLAKSEATIFFVTILQHFRLTAQPCPDQTTIDLVPVSGLTADTKPHLVRFIPRKPLQ